jgi:hypothetical protein
VVISLLVTLPRFSPGIPLSIDTTSHLYRVLYLSIWARQGLLPFWSPDWYAGSPTLLLYPPFGYYIAVGLTLLGIDPLVSYKLVDAFFYCAAPVSVFFLTKEFGFSTGEAALSSVLYSLVPEVIENYLFYDRFPTVIAIPIFCAFIIMFHRTLLRSERWIELFASILLMSALLLTHHLSALIAGLVAFLVIVGEWRKIRKINLLETLLLLSLGTFGVSAFWLVPFISSIGLFAGNFFYNRNVLFPFISFSYFTIDVIVYLLGLVQFALAVIALHLISSSARVTRLRLSFLSFLGVMLAGMAVFEIGVLFANSLVASSGQVVVILSFACFLTQFAFVDAQRAFQRGKVLIIAFWFILFLWLGLGYYALPILWLPYIRQIWIRTMDVYRVWLYFAIPMCALASKGFMKAFSAAQKPLVVIGLLLLLTIPMATGALLKVNYAFTSPVNGVLPYSAANADIPSQLTAYFKNDPSQGRVLGINVPFWIYLLPNYAGKPIVDGWYPQTKLVVPLVNINDYRIDDLETAPNNSARLVVWRRLITDSALLDITWVLIGGRTLATQLMTGESFAEELSIRYPDVNGFIDLILFKAKTIPSFVEIDSHAVSVGTVSEPNPDKIVITFEAVNSTVTGQIKEAYFPTWKATSDTHTLQVERDNATGYILLTVPAGTKFVVVYQDPDEEIWNIVSCIAALTCSFTFGLSWIRRRHV